MLDLDLQNGINPFKTWPWPSSQSWAFLPQKTEPTPHLSAVAGPLPLLFWFISFSQQKHQMMFLTANSFFECVFKNMDLKNICAFIVFKAESKPKTEEHFFSFFFFFKNQKSTYLGCPKYGVVFKIQKSNLFSVFVL